MPSRRGRRGGARAHRSPDRHQHVTAPAVAVQKALAPAARLSLMELWVPLSPSLDGAHVADAVELAYDADLFLAVTEPYWETHGDALSDELGERWGVVARAAIAGVVALGLTEAAAYGEPLSPPRDYIAFVGRLARHAARDEDGDVTLPSPRTLCAWLDENGAMAVRHPVVEELALKLSGSCDSCPHPQADHDLESGACRRVNPYAGPCPCAHTPAEVRERQRGLATG